LTRNEKNALDETEAFGGGVMDLSGVIVVALGILFFFGGAAWLEIRFRKGRLADGRGEQPPQHAVSITSGARAAHSRVAESD
jgi:hypothetical protein